MPLNKETKPNQTKTALFSYWNTILKSQQRDRKKNPKNVASGIKNNEL